MAAKCAKRSKNAFTMRNCNCKHVKFLCIDYVLGIPYSGKYWWGYKFGSLLVFRKSAKCNTRPMPFHNSTRTALLKYVSAEGRACAQVWHSLKEGDRTGERAHEVNS